MSEPAAPRGKIYDSILDTVGGTPLVRLDRLAKETGVKANILGKCEFFNPLASVKDRIGLAMIEAAEKDGRLKPGMFVRAEVVFQRVAEAVIVPEAALARRAGREGIFLVRPGGEAVDWRAVETGIRQDGRVQLFGEGLQGRVVVLGQQLLKDGSRITIAEPGEAATP